MFEAIPSSGHTSLIRLFPIGMFLHIGSCYDLCCQRGMGGAAVG